MLSIAVAQAVHRVHHLACDIVPTKLAGHSFSLAPSQHNGDDVA